MRRVSYIFPTSHHYRLPFHERLREILSLHDIDYSVVYCEPDLINQKKRDTVDIEWGRKVRSTTFRGLVYQHGLREALKSDLVIVQQENRLLLNYVCNIAWSLGRMRLAYFGHGRNFQARFPDNRSERFKRFWATKCDWWFGYTEKTRQHIESLGFPTERITVFNNAVDTKDLRHRVDIVTEERLIARRRELGLTGDHIGIFVGGLYEDKRPDFMIAAADKIREQVNDFEFLIIGDGPASDELARQAATRPWIKLLGVRFGDDKAELMRIADVFMMPGLLGLAVLDAAAAGLPVVTTAYPYHSPELAYLQHGTTGIIVDEWQDVDRYSEAVSGLLKDRGRLQLMSHASRQSAEMFTIEKMASAFATGILQCLNSTGPGLKPPYSG